MSHDQNPHRRPAKVPIQRVDVVCDDFESEWLAGRRPHLAKYLSAVPATDRSLLFSELLAMDIEYRRNSGEAVAYDDYAHGYPEFAHLIQREVDARGQTRGAPDAYFSTFRVGDDTTAALPAIDQWKLPGLELIEVIGRGGMGVVVRARQVDLNREVAVKLILAGRLAATEQRVRFRLEAEAVAALHHANIVQIYGADEFEGQPYIIMEHLSGESLSQRMARLPFESLEAASLIESLARGIHTAHLRGIIHRDLKPANVLIAADGVPKITDFGLAKRLTDDTSQTQSGMLLGSPRNMAPEQANGELVGPATDVYALGVILYEMLTRKLVFDGDTLWKLLDQIKSTEPTPPRRLRPEIPRDLEAICLQCLHKTPTQRYESAAALADDLQRFRTSRPIHARRVTPIERLALWTRRHRAIATLGLAIVAMLIVTMSGGQWYHRRLREEQVRAERRFELANDAINQIMAEIGEDREVIDVGTDDRRRQLLTKALAICQQLTEEDSTDAAARRRLGTAIRRKADVHRLLGEYQKSEQAYDQAIGVFQQLRQANPRDVDSARELAVAYNFQGETYRTTGRNERARRAYDHARQIQQTLLESASSEDTQADLARTYYNLGLVAKASSQLEAALRYFDAAEEQLARLTTADHSVTSYQQHRARVATNRGSALRMMRRADEASASFAIAIACYESLIESQPDHDEFRFEQALAQNNLGNLVLASNSQQALTHLQQAHDGLERLARQYPQVPRYQQELANTCNGLGAAHAAQGELSQAGNDWLEAVQSLEQVHRLGKGSPTTHADLATSLGNLGRLQLKQDDEVEAEATLRRGLSELQPALDGSPESPSCRQTLLNISADLAKALVRQHKYEESLAEGARFSQRLSSPSHHLLASLAFVDSCLRQLDSDKHDDAAVDRAALRRRFAELAQPLYQQASTTGELAESLATDSHFAKLRASLVTVAP